MTIAELYVWAENHDALDYEIRIQYRDEGGFYSGSSYLEWGDLEVENGEVVM